MRPGYCESKEEYQVSLRLLEEYISCDAVKKLLDGNTNIISHLKKFIRENVLVYEKHFLHFLRIDTRTLDVAHNSSHEGTNHGMKSCAAAVLPGHNLATAAKHMVVQGVISTKRLEEMSSKEFQQKKLWSVLPTAPFLVSTAEDILRQQVGRYKKYSALRVAKDEFEVCDKRLDHVDEEQEDDDPLASWTVPTCSDEEEEDHVEEDASMEQMDEKEADDNSDKQGAWYPPIPRFTRTRTVTWNEGGFYQCSCCHFERTGIPCVHIYAVVKMLHPDWKGFGHHDVAVRWWSAYVCHAFPCQAEENSLTTRLSDLADCDIKGPAIRLLPPPTLDHSSELTTNNKERRWRKLVT